jgi:hypothetical protein
MLAAGLPVSTWAQASTDWFEVKKSQGLVQQIKIHLTQQNKVLVLDQFTDFPSFVANEKKNFSKSSHSDGFCQKLPNPQACEQTCYWASKARPFGRARLQTVSGKTQWRWQAKKNETWSTLLAARGGPTFDGSCLSPDGKYLTTTAYFLNVDEDENISLTHALAGYAVVKIEPQFSGVEVIGKKTKEIFGHKHFTSLVGWQDHKPHTLIFEVMRPENDHQAIVDEGTPK